MGDLATTHRLVIILLVSMCSLENGDPGNEMSHQMMGALFLGVHYEVSYQKANEQMHLLRLYTQMAEFHPCVCRINNNPCQRQQLTRSPYCRITRTSKNSVSTRKKNRSHHLFYLSTGV